MVCLPCFIIPAFLWLYYRFLRPYMGPVMDKLELWFMPYIARFLPQTCPVKKPVKNSGVVRSKPESENVAKKQDMEKECAVDNEESLKNVVQSGGFGTDLNELRQRAPIVPVVTAFDGDSE